MPDPALGFVVITCDDPPLEVTARLGAERPDVSSGYGGWTEVPRPRRTTVTTWEGQPARRMTVAILLDNFRAGRSVETDIRRLERLALPRSGGQPPTVRLSAKGGHLPYPKARWVIDGIAWGDAAMNNNGNRTRQAATLSLLEFISDDLIRSSAQRRRAKGNAKSGKNNKKNATRKRKPVSPNRRVKKGAHTFAGTTASFEGEDLMAVAARELGDVRRWHEIADLNGIRDPRAIRTGQVLRLP